MFHLHQGRKHSLLINAYEHNYKITNTKCHPLFRNDRSTDCELCALAKCTQIPRSKYLALPKTLYFQHYNYVTDIIGNIVCALCAFQFRTTSPSTSFKYQDP